MILENIIQKQLCEGPLESSGKKIKNRVRSMIEDAEQAEKISELAGLKKMRGGENYFRIRIGSYRVGVIIDSDTTIFVRFLNRKDIYRYFP